MIRGAQGNLRVDPPQTALEVTVTWRQSKRDQRKGRLKQELNKQTKHNS